ncbi:sentrin-specific protease 1-like [Ixodes scapularis]
MEEEDFREVVERTEFVMREKRRRCPVRNPHHESTGVTNSRRRSKTTMKKRMKHSSKLRRFLPSVDGLVLPKLTGPMLEEIETALRPTPAHEALAKGYGLTISRSDMSTLAEYQWLNDEVVNFYMNLLVERTKQNSDLPKLYAFNTFFFTKMAAEGHSAVRRWTKEVDLFSYDIVLVPLHFTDHWCLATIDFRKKHIAYYDSMGNSRERRNCLHKLQLYLEAESQDRRGHGLDWEPWELQVISDLPQQHNDSDCGIFTCQYAECVSRDAEISFGQQDVPYFRKRMVYEILHGQLLPV